MQKPNLERPIQMIFRVSEREREFIFKKMTLAKTKNKTAYLRKMAIDGYILNVDFSEFRELFADVGSISRSINQIAKRINSTDRIYSNDITELKNKQDDVWNLLKSLQSKIVVGN